jgi:hypothetical protein
MNMFTIDLPLQARENYMVIFYISIYNVVSFAKCVQRNCKVHKKIMTRSNKLDIHVFAYTNQQ